MKRMRRLKLVALSALAVLALSAVSASAATAAEGTVFVSAGTTSYTSLQVGLPTLTLTGGRVLSCNTEALTGSITNGAKTISATPSYAGCTVKVGASTLPATVSTGSCTYKFSDLTTIGADSYSASTDLVCPSGDVSIKVYANAANHSAGTRLCEYTIKPRTGLSGVNIYDNTEGTFRIVAFNVALITERVFGTVVNCGEASFFASYNSDNVIWPSSGFFVLDD